MTDHVREIWIDKHRHDERARDVLISGTLPDGEPVRVLSWGETLALGRERAMLHLPGLRIAVATWA